MEKLKTLIGTIAPWLAGSFGTPAAGAAVKVICDVLGLDAQTATPDTMAAAIQSATPDQLLAMKQADNQHAELMAKLGYDNLDTLARITVDDRNGARGREVAVRDRTPAMLAALSVLFFLGLLVAVAGGLHPASDMQPGFWMLAGAAIAVLKDVYGYYFGSSAGSQGKDATIANMAQGAGQ